MCHRCSNTAYMKIVHEDADMMLTMYISEDHIYIYIYTYPIWCHLFICSKIWGIRSYEYIGEIEIWPYPTCGWSDRWEDGEWWLSSDERRIPVNNGTPLGAPSRIDDNIPYCCIPYYTLRCHQTWLAGKSTTNKVLLFSSYEPFIYRGFCSVRYTPWYPDIRVINHIPSPEGVYH